MVEKEKGCVYFFKHIGLTPIKIGFSSNESPIGRFDQFRTYAPFGAELIGFIRTYNPTELETILHAKHSSKRLKGEWFEITREEAERDINFYSDIADVEEMNNFQIEWAKKKDSKRVESARELVNIGNYKEHIEKVYRQNKNFNKTLLADKLGISRMTVHRVVKEIQKNK